MGGNQSIRREENGAVCRTATLTLAMLWCAVCGQIDSTKHLSSDSLCTPMVVISLRGTSINVCLNQFGAGNDSCTDFTVRIQNPYRFDVRFRYTFYHRWYFDSVVSQDPLAPPPPLHAEVSVDNAGVLLGISIRLESLADSTPMLLNARQNGDMHRALPDTSPKPIEYVLQKSAYVCVDRAVYGITVLRTFTYPPGYMRREPVYNYPELSMFHYGGSVMMPSNASVFERGVLVNYWHILHPPSLNYHETSLNYIDDQKTKPPGPKKKAFFQLRPLQ